MGIKAFFRARLYNPRMQIRPVAATSSGFTPLSIVPAGPVDAYVPGLPTPSTPSLSQVLAPVSNTQVEQYRFQLPGEVNHAPAVGPDGSLYCAHSQGLTVLSPQGQETGRYLVRDGLVQRPLVRPDGSVLVCDREGLTCLDKTGKVLFERQLGVAGAPPALGPEGRIYYPEKTGHLTCLDSEGKPLWSYQTEPQRRDGGWPGYIRGELAVAPEGGVILSAEGTMHILDARGQLQHKLLGDPKGWGISTGTGPTLAPDGSILVSRSTNRVECYERDGTLRWSTSLDKPESDALVGGLAATTPRCHEGLVVVGAGSGELSGLDLATGQLKFQNNLQASMSGDRVQISSDGTIYAAGQYSSNAHAVDLQGERLWSFKFPDRAERAFMASQGENVFMVSQQGQVHALRSDTVQAQLASLPPGEDPGRQGIALSNEAVIVGGVRVKRR